MVNNSCKSGNRVSNIFGDVESVFDHLFATANSAAETYRPVWDVIESGDSFTVSLELPGMKPEDVSVEFEGGVLTISGEKSVDRTDDKSTYHRSERTTGKFSRTLEFSTPIESDGIEASFNNGLLEVVVPKSEKAQPRKITVNTVN